MSALRMASMMAGWLDSLMVARSVVKMAALKVETTAGSTAALKVVVSAALKVESMAALKVGDWGDSPAGGWADRLVGGKAGPMDDSTVAWMALM